jgi:hypothetical protein
MRPSYDHRVADDAKGPIFGWFPAPYLVAALRGRVETSGV